MLAKSWMDLTGCWLSNGLIIRRTCARMSPPMTGIELHLEHWILKHRALEAPNGHNRSCGKLHSITDEPSPGEYGPCNVLIIKL